MRLRWILISYFMISGGVAVALTALGFAWLSSGTIDTVAFAKLLEIAEKGMEPGQPLPVSLGNVELAMALTYASGAAFGAFFVGRASPHKSYIEPAIAAALVVGSFLLAIYLTPMGKLFLSLTGGHLERLVSILAGAGIVAGLLGAILGELATYKTGAAGFVRQTGLSILIAAGAIWSAVMIIGLVFANEVAEQSLANFYGDPNAPVVQFSVARAVTLGGIAVTIAAFATGIVAQLSSPRNVVAEAALASFLVAAGIGGLGAVIPHVSDDLATQVAFGGGAAAAVLTAASAYLVWFVVPNRGANLDASHRIQANQRSSK